MIQVGLANVKKNIFIYKKQKQSKFADDYVERVG